MAQVVDNFVPDNVIAGNTQIVTDSVTVKSGTVLKVGSVVGVASATDAGLKTVIESKKTASDGSEKPYGIAVTAVDASAGDVMNVPVYIKCEYNIRAVEVDASWKIDEMKDALRPQGINLKNTVAR